MHGAAGGLVAFLLVVLVAILAVALYLAPSVIAIVRRHHQVAAIIVVNVLLGWTFVGWVLSLAWAVSYVPPG